ncbi:MAG: aquaporin [Bryobacteraceae bacterium]
MQTPTASIEYHWPEYLMEASGLGIFLFAACAFGVLLGHPASPVNQAISSDLVRRMLMGVAMGTTSICLVYSPWGQRSGAHFNPAFTLSYYFLGKVKGWDAIFYITAQFAGGVAGVFLADLIIGFPLRHSAVNYVVTVPGPAGPGTAFLAEILISLTMMFTVLAVSNSKPLHRWTPLFAGFLVALYIAVESPVSGMSMNPARTFGSAFPAQDWNSLWVYFTAPLLGMFAAGQLYRVRRGANGIFCAKLYHPNGKRCIFRCNFAAL